MSSVSPTIRIAITLCFMMALLIASVIPGRAQPGDSVFVWIVAKTPTALQKTLHLILYALLAMLWAWSLEAIESRSQRLLVAITVAIGFGAAMEWYQTKVPGRYGTIVDVGLNAVGALLGIVAALILF